jgi:hypothetical protein
MKNIPASFFFSTNCESKFASGCAPRGRTHHDVRGHACADLRAGENQQALHRVRSEREAYKRPREHLMSSTCKVSSIARYPRNSPRLIRALCRCTQQLLNRVQFPHLSLNMLTSVVLIASALAGGAVGPSNSSSPIPYVPLAKHSCVIRALQRSLARKPAFRDMQARTRTRLPSHSVRTVPLSPSTVSVLHTLTLQGDLGVVHVRMSVSTDCLGGCNTF